MSTTAEDRSPGQVLYTSFGTPHGDNWSGWQVPAVEPPEPENLFSPRETAGLAATGNHLYILAPDVGLDGVTPAWNVWAY